MPSHRTRPRLAVGLAALVLVPTIVVGCVTGEGPVVHETRELRPFRRVEVGSGIHLVVTIGPATTIDVGAQANLLDAIATEVTTDTLHVEAAGDFTTTEPVTVTVSTPTLEAVVLSGGAEASLDGLEVMALEVVAKGGSRVTASGAVSEVTLTADGGSQAHLGDLVASTVHVTLAGGSEVVVTADEAVDGRATGGARLTVGGLAATDVAISGGATIVTD
jgi:hypothetical protein